MLTWKQEEGRMRVGEFDPQLVKQAFDELPNPDLILPSQCGLCETCRHDPAAHSQCDGNAPNEHRYPSWHQTLNELVYLTTEQNVAFVMPEIRQKALEDMSHYLTIYKPEYGGCAGCEAGADCEAAHTCR